MATPTALDMISDLAKWANVLDAGRRVLMMNVELLKEVEAVRGVAKRADQTHSDRDSVKQFKKSMRDVCDSSDTVLAIGKTLCEIEKRINTTLKEALETTPISIQIVGKCISKLNALLEVAQTFVKKFSEFRKCFDDVVQICQNLIAEFGQEKADAEKAAADRRWKGNVGALGLTVGSAVLGIAAFFTGGASLVGAGALGAAAVGGSACSLVGSRISAKEMDKEASEFQKFVTNLSLCMKEMKMISDRLTENAQVGEELSEAIAYVIETYRDKQEQLKRGHELQEEIRQLREREIERDERMREMAEELRRTREQQDDAPAVRARPGATANEDAGVEAIRGQAARELQEKDRQIAELQRKLLDHEERMAKIAKMIGRT